jgi:CRP-like cAMP-binding protein
MGCQSNMTFSIDKYHFGLDSILEGLPEPESKILREKTVTREIRKGAIIYREGTYPKGAYLLKKGKVKIYQVNQDGKERLLFIYTKGALLGYSPILCDELNSFSAKALEDCTISFIPENVFQRVLKKSSILQYKLLHALCREFTAWTHQVSSFTQNGVRERVALCLLILSEKYRKKEKNNLPVEIPISRDDLAGYVGSTKETVVRMLRYFKDNKILETKGRRIIIFKPKELEKMVDAY